MRICDNGVYRDMTPSEIEEYTRLQQEHPVPTPEPDRLTAVELAVAELGATVAAMVGGESGG